MATTSTAATIRTRSTSARRARPCGRSSASGVVVWCRSGTFRTATSLLDAIRDDRSRSATLSLNSVHDRLPWPVRRTWSARHRELWAMRTGPRAGPKFLCRSAPTTVATGLTDEAAAHANAFLCRWPLDAIETARQPRGTAGRDAVAGEVRPGIRASIGYHCRPVATVKLHSSSHRGPDRSRGTSPSSEVSSQRREAAHRSARHAPSATRRRGSAS